MAALDVWPNNIIVALILSVGLAGFLLNVRLAALFRRLRSDLDQLRTGTQRPATLAWAVDEYVLYLQGHGMKPNAGVIVDKVLSRLSVSWLPVPAVERLVRFASSAPVLMGLAGNFIGWLIALGSLSQKWPQVTDELRLSEMKVLLEALRGPLAGLNTAFLLSVVGLVVSLLVSLSTYFVHADAEKERFAAEFEDYLEHATAIPAPLADTSDLLVRLLDRFAQMAGTIEQSVGSMMSDFGQVLVRVDTTVAAAAALVQSMQPVAAVLERASGAVEAVGARMDLIASRMEGATTAFAGGATTLESGLQSFATGVQRLADTQERSVALLSQLQAGTAHTLDMLSSRIAALERVEGQLEATAAQTLGALRSLVDPVLAASTQLREQYLVLEEQSRRLEEGVGKLRVSADHLGQAAETLQASEERFVNELERNLDATYQAHLQILVESLDKQTRLLGQMQESYHHQLEGTVGALVQYLSHPVVQQLVDGLQRLSDGRTR